MLAAASSCWIVSGPDRAEVAASSLSVGVMHGDVVSRLGLWCCRGDQGLVPAWCSDSGVPQRLCASQSWNQPSC